ncbi:Fur family transcriptional regulator [Sphingomonas bacterium]|uniref:Fur family transcriptional regulator n=1 Tax=Sphingomonas bacterium TaxID=1895847 RepID=UPI0015762581|nr:transcriptional repressor [Sphingomonas bacterium]
MAHAHTHEEPKGKALARAAQATLERAGEQWTTMRSTVFDALAGFDRPASAYDLTEVISKREQRRVAANSVYRILDLFLGANLVRRVESKNAYVINAHPDCLHDCIFLVCDRCGRTIHLDDDTITNRVRAVAEQAGYVPQRPVIEVRGLCAACAAAT